MTQAEEIKERVSDLEKMFKDLLYAQFKTEEFIHNLAKEMKDFKDEMKDFKDEMKDFKDEMKQMSKDLNKKWGDLVNKMGTIVEDLIIPNLPLVLDKFFNLGEPEELMLRYRKKIKSKNLEKEFDTIIIYHDKKTIVLNETKSKSDINSIKKFAEFIKNEIFFEYFPEYKKYKLIPIYSSINIEKEHVSELTKNKIFAIIVNGDILNFQNFEELKEFYS